ncbi:hypothetical protein POM88_010849 [Heracleum sosnowskyi]|nr:hypothetical protein POM88_010849 [Heracleum sosnowskyi]
MVIMPVRIDTSRVAIYFAKLSGHVCWQEDGSQNSQRTKLIFRFFKLDTEYDEEEKKEDKGLILETKAQQNLPKKRRYYLQPHTPICDIDVMKFTVVDTSSIKELF